jgi:hypothetical protein
VGILVTVGVGVSEGVSVTLGMGVAVKRGVKETIGPSVRVGKLRIASSCTSDGEGVPVSTSSQAAINNIKPINSHKCLRITLASLGS